MKANIFFLTVLFAFSALLCKGESLANYQSTDTLYFMGSRNISIDSIKGTGTLLPPEELAFTGDDIKYFNLTTEEIIFSDSFASDTMTFIKRLLTYYIYNIYLNDKLLLENVEATTGVSSRPINDLVFYFDAYNTNKLYLNDGYPNWKDINYPPDEEFQQVRDENAQKRKAGWDIFINYLSENGKIVGTDITGVENAETTLPVQIYSAGKTIYVNNRTGKTGVVTVYSIAGVKIAEQTMAGQTTTLEIPVGGFYAVSVKAGNEKPVTAKLIVR